MYIIPNSMPRKAKETKKIEQVKKVEEDKREIVLQALGSTNQIIPAQEQKIAPIPSVTPKVKVQKTANKKESLLIQKKIKNKQNFKKSTSTQGSEVKVPKRRKEHFWRKTIPFFIVIALLLLIVFLQSGLYFNSKLHTSASWLAKKIHYPVAVVGIHVVTYNQLQSERDMLLAYAQKGLSVPSDSLSVDALVLNKIFRSVMVEQAKKKYSSHVSDSVVEQAFVNLFGAQSDSRDAQLVSELVLGLSPEHIKQDIIKPYLEKAALTENLLQDSMLIQQQKTTAEKIQIQVSANPRLFSDEKTYTKATVKFFDLGYIQASAFFGDFASVANLPVGEVSQVMEDANSYSIFKVVERLPVAENATNEFIKVQKIEVLKITADLWVDSELQASRVAVFDPSLSWDATCHQVTSQGFCYRSSLGAQTVTLDELYDALTSNSSIFAPSFLTK